MAQQINATEAHVRYFARPDTEPNFNGKANRDKESNKATFFFLFFGSNPHG
jgi:hypothetical protein